MRCEVLAVGTELLLGQIVDTNSSFIGEQLALVGIDCLHQVKVGDNLARIVESIRVALDRADAVIICGGLGPTHDDITREAMAEVMGVELVHDEAIAEVIRRMFASRGRTMAVNNLRQALVPVGATVIPQTMGTAPGLICPVGDKVAYLVVGVPHEMKDMIARGVLPDLRRRSGDTGAIVSRVLRTWGDSESGLNERLDPIITRLEAEGNPTLAFLASGWEGIKVRLTAKAATVAEATAQCDFWDAQVRAVVASQVFGVDDDTMESVVLDLLRQRGLTLAVAESVTGGLVASRLTGVAGASDVFRGGLVAYSSELKFDILGVTPGPVVSRGAAAEMALGVVGALGADVGLSLTGVAGPGEQDGQPVGTLHVGIAIGNTVITDSFRLPGQREQMRQLAVISSLNMLRRALLDRPLAP
jgi:nicotinamide-nucleotide amidase